MDEWMEPASSSDGYERGTDWNEAGEAELSSRRAAGREVALHAFIARHAHTIHQLARTHARDDGMRREAGDVAQQVVVGLLQGSLDPSRLDRAEAYLCTVVRRASNRARRRRSEAEQLSPTGEAPEMIDATFVDHDAGNAHLALERGLDGERRLQRLQERLRPRDAHALALLVNDTAAARDTDTLAQALGTNANNVYQIRHRISRAVQTLIDEEAAETSPPETEEPSEDHRDPLVRKGMTRPS